MRSQYASLCLIAGALAASSCGLANGFGHAEHGLYDDAIGVCAWCLNTDDGFPCVVDHGDAECSTRAALSDCNVASALLEDEPNDNDAPSLSPVGSVSGGEIVLKLDGERECPERYTSAAVDLLIMHDAEPDPFNGAKDESDADDLSSMFAVGAERSAFVAAASWTPVDVPWPRDGYVVALSVDLCVGDRGEGQNAAVALRALTDDGATNPVCADPEE